MDVANYNHDYYLKHKKHILASNKYRYHVKINSASYRKLRHKRNQNYFKQHQYQLDNKRLTRYYHKRHQVELNDVTNTGQGEINP